MALKAARLPQAITMSTELVVICSEGGSQVAPPSSERQRQRATAKRKERAFGSLLFSAFYNINVYAQMGFDDSIVSALSSFLCVSREQTQL